MIVSLFKGHAEAPGAKLAARKEAAMRDHPERCATKRLRPDATVSKRTEPCRKRVDLITRAMRRGSGLGAAMPVGTVQPSFALLPGEQGRDDDGDE